MQFGGRRNLYSTFDDSGARPEISCAAKDSDLLYCTVAVGRPDQ